MVAKLLRKIVGTRNDRELKRMGKIVVRINALATDVDLYIKEGAPQVIAFFGDTKPTSTTYQVPRLVHPDWLIEIEATAVIPR